MSILGVNIDTSNVPKMETSQTIGGKIQEASKTFNEFLKSSPEMKIIKKDLSVKIIAQIQILKLLKLLKPLKILKLLKLLKRRIFKILKRQIK